MDETAFKRKNYDSQDSAQGGFFPMKEKGFYEASRKFSDKMNLQAPQSVKRKIVTMHPFLPNKQGASQALKICSHIAVTVVCLLCTFMLNMSPVYAQSTENTSTDKDLIRVFTARNYSYSACNHEMDMDVPNLSDPRCSEAAGQINKEVDAWTARLAEQFYSQLEADGDKGHGAVFVDYEVLMSTKNWFTLKLTVSTVTGSSNQYYKIYNINRSTGKIVTFSDLFCTSEFGRVIKQNILKQMKERTEKNSNLVYFTEPEASWEISHTQNFYFNENGELVIPFDKYAVAPGSMGNPEFTISKETLSCILRPEYKDMTDTR